MQHAALQSRLQGGLGLTITAALHGINQYRTITSCACTAETDITSLNTGCDHEDKESIEIKLLDMCLMKMTGITSIFQDNINMVSIINML